MSTELCQEHSIISNYDNFDLILAIAHPHLCLSYAQSIRLTTSRELHYIFESGDKTNESDDTRS